MAKGVTDEAKVKKTGFLREVLGLAVILFSLLAFLCLVTGDSLFYTLGLGVRNLLFGVFGVYSFIFLAHTFMFGMALVWGKFLIPKSKRLVAFCVRALIVCLILVLHLCISFDGSLPFAEEVSLAYQTAFVSGTSVGGAVASALVLPVSLIITKVGAIVFFVVLFLIIAAFLFRKPIATLFTAQGGASAPKRKSKTAPKKKEKTEKTATTSEKPEEAGEERPAPRVTNFFFNERSDFAFRTKREIAEGGRRQLGPFTGRFETKTIVDFARREAYGKGRAGGPSVDTPPSRPAAPAGETVSVSPFAPDRSIRNGQASVNGSSTYFSDPSPAVDKRTESSSYDGMSYEKDVYTIPVGGERSGEPSRGGAPTMGAATSAGTRGGIFDGTRSGESPSGRGMDGGYDAPSRAEDSYGKSPSGRDVYTMPTSVGRTTSAGARPDDVASTPYGGRGVESSSRTGGESTLRTGGDTRINTDTATRMGAESSPRMGGDPRVGTESTLRTGGTAGYSERVTEVRNIPTESRAGGDRTGAGMRTFDETAGATGEEAPTRPTESRVRAAMPAAEPTSAEPVQEEINLDDDIFDERGYAFIKNMPLNYRYTRPRLDLFADYTMSPEKMAVEKQRQEFCKERIVSVFRNKGINVSIVNVVTGSAVTRYDVAIPEDVSMTSVRNCREDLAMRLKTSGEFNMERIPGTDLIGIEVASESRATVGMKSILQHRGTAATPFEKGIYFMLGEDVLSTPVYLNLVKMPHLMVCGATGTGKSVCLNTMLISLMYRYSPEDLRFVIVDPKAVEFVAFQGIPHLLFNEILGLDDNGKASKAIAVLEWAVQEMQRRYKFLARRGFKDIKSYNAARDPAKERKIPYVIILIDEFADFIMVDPESKKSIDTCIGRLAQKARAAGISLVLATQRPTVDIMSGNIKTNVPSRICFKMSSGKDSQVVLDDPRAEKLLGMGDCYYKTSENPNLQRAQGAYVSDEELYKVVNFVKEHNKCYFDNEILENINRAAKRVGQTSDDDGGGGGELPSPNAQAGGKMSLDPADASDVAKRALRIAIAEGKISTSRLRSLTGLGYNKANYIIIWMERMGYITPPLEAQKRNTLISREEYEEIYGEFIEDF